jgi:hypothetical protein
MDRVLKNESTVATKVRLTSSERLS